MSNDGWIETYTGVKFYPLAPRLEDINIDDIAWSLSNQNRFLGHSKIPWSVARHSIAVSRACCHSSALMGLLHDASEAYLGDLPSPLKRMPEFAFYREAERVLQELIYARFDVTGDADEVKRCDVGVLAVERWYVMEAQHEWPSLSGAERGSKFDCVSQAFIGGACAAFLQRFHELTGGAQ